MIFKPELARLVAKGKKTQTRRIVVDGKPCPYEVGRDYAVQPGRGKPQICKITILDRQRQTLGLLTQQDAIAEGFHARANFARYWMGLYDQRYDLAGQPADEVLELWLARHGDREVFVITFELQRVLQLVLPDTPVYLHRNPARGSTTDARQKAPGEPELMGAELKIGSVGRARQAAKRARQAQIQQVHELVDRARNAYEEAIAVGIALEPDLALLERQVLDLERKLKAA